MCNGFPSYSLGLNFTELINLGIKISDEHRECKFDRRVNNLRCVNHKKTVEYLNKDEMIAIHSLMPVVPVVAPLTDEELRVKIRAMREAV